MKLQDALRQIVSERGIDALSERSLIELLDGLGGFAEYPAMWQVMGTIAERGCGKRLCRIRRDEGLAGAIGASLDLFRMTSASGRSSPATRRTALSSPWGLPCR